MIEVTGLPSASFSGIKPVNSKECHVSAANESQFHFLLAACLLIPFQRTIMLNLSAAPLPAGSVSKVVSFGIYRSALMVKESVPATAEEGKSIEPGQGALSSPHGEVPVGSPILTDPTLPYQRSSWICNSSSLSSVVTSAKAIGFVVNPAPISSQLSPRIVAPFTAIDEAKNNTRSGVFHH